MIYYDGYDWDFDGFPGELIYGDDMYVDDYYMDERWKRDIDICDYWVSNKGRVWSSISEKFLVGTPVGYCGHLDVSLRCNGHRVHKYIHRMVAEAFLPNPYNLPVVRHLDDNPSNNCVENLAWGTQLDNVRDCIENGHFKPLTEYDREKAMQKRRDPVIAVDLESGKEYRFASQCEAARVIGITQGSINAVLRGKNTNACGFYFYRPDEGLKIDLESYRYSRKYAPILAFNTETGEQYIFNGQTDAANALGLSVGSVCNCVNGKIRKVKGYQFRYLDKEVRGYD